MTNKEFERIKMMAAQAKAEKEAEAKRKAEAKCEAEARAREEVREKNREFERDLKNGTLEKYGFTKNNSSLIPGYEKGDIVVSYYGGELCCIEIAGEGIDEIFDMPFETGCYDLTSEALVYLRELIAA